MAMGSKGQWALEARRAIQEYIEVGESLHRENQASTSDRIAFCRVTSWGAIVGGRDCRQTTMALAAAGYLVGAPQDEYREK